MPQYKIYNKNNMDVLRDMADGSLHAVVTDCPYGLGKEPNASETLKAWLDTGYHEITGSGFMGKKWDSFVPQPLFWKEVYRVLKPGGYVLAFFGTRTYDWGTLAIRLAGFEIRDCMQWIYGSGFPKSLDVSKALNKNDGVSFEKVPAAGVGFMNAEGEGGYNATKNQLVQTGTSTPTAKQWSGYGTALKPACELICVARKPLQGTVADNVLRHGCGAINLDGGRIAHQDEAKTTQRKGRDNASVMTNESCGFDNTKHTIASASPLGRFPSNVILDEEAARVMDEQGGVSKSGKVKNDKAAYEGESNTGFLRGFTNSSNQHGDSGGASRFFYVAKASKSDRNYGTSTKPNNHATVKPIKLMRYLVRLVKPPVAEAQIADFFLGSGTTGIACMLEGIDFIGCDDDENSFNIASARIAHAQKEFHSKLF